VLPFHNILSIIDSKMVVNRQLFTGISKYPLYKQHLIYCKFCLELDRQQSLILFQITGWHVPIPVLYLTGTGKLLKFAPYPEHVLSPLQALLRSYTRTHKTRALGRLS